LVAKTSEVAHTAKTSEVWRISKQDMEIYFHAITQLTNPPLYDILSRVMQKQIRHPHHLFAQPFPRVG
jgi:hypothetical protein